MTNHEEYSGMTKNWRLYRAGSINAVATKYDDVKAGLYAMQKEGVNSVFYITTNTSSSKSGRTTVTINVSEGSKKPGEDKRNGISITDAVAYIAHVKGDNSALSFDKSAGASSAMTEENCEALFREVVEFTAKQNYGGGERAMLEAKAFFMKFLDKANGSVKGFASADLASITAAKYCIKKQEAASAANLELRMKMLQEIKEGVHDGLLDRLGYGQPALASARKHFFTMSKRYDKDGKIRETFTLREHSGDVPQYIDERTKKHVAMRPSANGLYYIDPRDPKVKDVDEGAHGTVKINARGPRGERTSVINKEAEDARASLLKSGVAESIVKKLTNKEAISMAEHQSA